DSNLKSVQNLRLKAGHLNLATSALPEIWKSGKRASGEIKTHGFIFGLELA
ncbi:hypothetical protein CEXT_815521, partial [Caerostris extrusa]